MKKLLLSLTCALVSIALVAQEPVVIGVKMPANSVLNEQAQQVLVHKLQQLTTLNNVGTKEVNSRFVLVPQVTIAQSELAPSTPPKQLVKLGIVLMVSDNANTKNVVAQTELSSKGVGTSESAAILDALQQINVRSAVLKRFMESAKSKLAALPAAEFSEDVTPVPPATPSVESEKPSRISIESCHPDIIFAVTQCSKMGNSFLMKFTVLNQGTKDINNFLFLRSDSQAYDDEGNAYRLDYIEFSNATSLPKGLKIKGELQVKNVDDQAAEFVQIKLSCYSSSVNLTSNFITLRNVPILP